MLVAVTSSSCLLTRQGVVRPASSLGSLARVTNVVGSSSHTARRLTGRTMTSSVVKSQQIHSSRAVGRNMMLGAMTVVAASSLYNYSFECGANNNHRHQTCMAARIPTSGDVLSMGMPTKEKATGIMFPPLCNGLSLVGVGVRIKYVFVKVYAVGTYVDPVAMMAIKKGSTQDIEKALLDPTYPRTIRIVMNRGLSIDKYTAAIVEAIEPRMKGQELEKLDEFKKLNPPVDLIEGAEIEMTIRGDTLLYKNAVGGVGSMTSRLFCEALCDVYYGNDPVSPTHKESVLEGIPKL